LALNLNYNYKKTIVKIEKYHFILGLFCNQDKKKNTYLFPLYLKMTNGPCEKTLLPLEVRKIKTLLNYSSE